MSGVVHLNNELSWVVAGWTYRNVLEMTQRHLDEQPGSPLDEAIKAGTGERLLFIDLEKLSKEDIDRFSQATMLALKDAERAGPVSFKSPEFYPGFIRRFHELVEMLSKRAGCEPS